MMRGHDPTRLKERPSVTHKIDPVELITKASACFDRGTELSLAEHVSIQVITRNHGRIAGLAGDQRCLAEKVPCTQRGDITAFTHHLDRALGNQEKLFADIALADDDITLTKRRLVIFSATLVSSVGV